MAGWFPRSHVRRWDRGGGGHNDENKLGFKLPLSCKKTDVAEINLYLQMLVERRERVRHKCLLNLRAEARRGVVDPVVHL